MFNFLKDKVKSAISSITKRFEDEAEPVEEEVIKEEIPLPEKVEKPKEPSVLEEKPKKKETQAKKQELPRQKGEPQPVKEKEVEKPFEEQKEAVAEEIPKEEKGFFAKIAEKVTTKKISAEQFDTLFWDLEVELMENNVAFEVIEKIKEDLKQRLVDVPLKRGEVEKIILESLKHSIEDVLAFERIDVLSRIKEKKPFVIVFIGINGSGKTTSIAKFAHFLQKNNLSCVLAAADTFRAASIQQLEEHGNNLGLKVIKHDYGSDPAAVAFDAVKYAKQKHIDVVLVDTAGRQHSNVNLRDEMKKIIRVVNPDLKIYVGEMISGNDCIDQIREFDKAINIDGAILSKADIDEKGGTAISVSYVTKKPILYIGVGQHYPDLKEFRKEDILQTLFGSK